MPIVPLRISYINKTQFVDSLFQSDVRNQVNMVAAATGTDLARWAVVEWIARQPDIDAIINGWLHCWLTPTLAGLDDQCPPKDQGFIKFLSNYILTNRMRLWVPDLRSSPRPVGPPKYRIVEWNGLPLRRISGAAAGWHPAHVRLLLTLFAAGAHFLVLHSRLDVRGPPIQNFYTRFAQTPHIPNSDKATAYMHSHYGGGVRTAYAYPNIWGGAWSGDTAPADCPFICSLIIDRTAGRSDFDGAASDGRRFHPSLWFDELSYNRETDTNSFFQLEGWPGVMTRAFGATGRHFGDYTAHTNTLWNISTYGLCPYSEKRNTPIILAPQHWNLSVDRQQKVQFVGAHNVTFAADTWDTAIHPRITKR